MFGSLPIENESEIMITVSTNLGLEHISIPVVPVSSNTSVDTFMQYQNRRLLVENERSRITKERFDVLLPRCGMFSHVYQMKGFHRSKDKFNINCYIKLNQEYFAGCVITSPLHLADLHEEFDTWDKNLMNADITADECLCILSIRPWELMVIKIENIVFL